MHPPRPLRTVAATTVAALTASLALSLAPAGTAATPAGSAAHASAQLVFAAVQPAPRHSARARHRKHEPRAWARLTTYRRAVLEGCRPPADRGFRRLVLRLRNVHDKRLRRAEITFKDRRYALPWSGSARTPWVRAGHAAPLARVSTSGRLVTQRMRVRLRTPHDVSPARSLRWTDVPACERRGRR